MLNAIKDAVRKSSIHVCIVNCGGCNGCDVECVALLSPRYDLEQYGIYVHNNPREADVLLLTGAVTEQWVDNLKRIYDKAPEPKIAVAVGNCPVSGDVFNQEELREFDELIKKEAMFMRLHLISSRLLQIFLDVRLDLVKYWRLFWLWAHKLLQTVGGNKNDSTYWSDSPSFKRAGKA